MRTEAHQTICSASRVELISFLQADQARSAAGQDPGVAQGGGAQGQAGWWGAVVGGESRPHLAGPLDADEWRVLGWPGWGTGLLVAARRGGVQLERLGQLAGQPDRFGLLGRVEGRGEGRWGLPGLPRSVGVGASGESVDGDRFHVDEPGPGAVQV